MIVTPVDRQEERERRREQGGFFTLLGFEGFDPDLDNFLERSLVEPRPSGVPRTIIRCDLSGGRVVIEQPAEGTKRDDGRVVRDCHGHLWYEDFLGNVTPYTGDDPKGL